MQLIYKKMQRQNNLQTKITNISEWADNEIVRQKNWTFKLPNQVLYHSQYQFPFNIYPAYGNTFLIRCLNQSKVKHILHDGTLLKQRNLEGGNIYMMTEKIAAIWSYSFQQQKYYIMQWDLESNQIVKVSYENMLKGQQSVYFQVLAFSQSKLFCVVERTQNGDKISITYQQFPFISDTDKPVYQHVFELKLKLGPTFYFDKTNNHSGLIWRNVNINSQEFQFFTFDLKSSNKIEEHKFNHGIKLKQLYKIQVFDVWQLSEQKIYIKMKVKADSQQFANKYRKIHFSERGKIATALFQQEKYYQFIWNMKDKSYHSPKYLQSTLKQLQSTLKLKKEYHIQFINSLRPIKILQLDSDYNRYDQFTKFDQMRKPPYPHYRMKNIYYVDPQSEQIVAVQQFLSSHSPSQFGYYFSDANSSLYYEYYLKWNHNQVQFLIKQLRVNSLVYNEQIYIAFLLLGLFQGHCEEDIINYVVNLVQLKETTEQQKAVVQKKNQYN